MRIPVLGLVIVFTALSASAGAQDADNRLTLDLYLEYESVSGPRLSPDGQRVIYSRQWVDKVNDKRESSLGIMDVDGSRNRFLVEGSGARCSPSGVSISVVGSCRTSKFTELAMKHSSLARWCSASARRASASS